MRDKAISDQPVYLIPNSNMGLETNPIHNTEDLKTELSRDLWNEYDQSISEPDTTYEQEEEVYNDFVSKEEKIQDNPFDFAKNNYVTLSYYQMKDLSQDDFEYDYNDKFVDLEELERTYKNKDNITEKDMEEKRPYTAKENTNSMLGSVIYEHNNPDQQVLLIQDLKNKDKKAFDIDNNLDIRHDSNKQSLHNILSDDNKRELDTAIRKQQDTSFTLSNKELTNINRSLLSDQRYNSDMKEGESLKQLKHLYQSYQSSLKHEATGELTQEKVADRMKAENSYKTLKDNTIKENPDMAKSIGNMEYNVKQKNKQSSNEQTM